MCLDDMELSASALLRRHAVRMRFAPTGSQLQTRISYEAILYHWICDLLGGSEWRCVEVVFSGGTKWAGSRSWIRKWIGYVDCKA